MQSDIFYQYNPWWEDNQFPVFFHERKILQSHIFSHLESKSKSVLFLTGLRRVGKTSLMKLDLHRI
jgi:predicted AAA+ superfamily ATPase